MVPFSVVAESPVNGAVLLVVVGDLDITTVSTFASAAQQAVLENPDCGLRVDLSDVGFIDSTGINGLVALQAVEKDRGRKLELVAWSTYVERVLRLVGLSEMFA